MKLKDQTLRTLTIIAAIAGAWALLIVAMTLTAPKAKAQDGYGDGGIHWDWSLGTGDPQRRWHRTYAHHAPRHYDYDRASVRYYRSPEESEWREERGERRHEPRDGFECVDRAVEVVSTEHNSEEQARESAKKLWMVQVSWKYGGRFLDLGNAADYLEKCGPSNPMDTLTGRLIEGAQKLVGHEDGQNIRCQIKARPCSAPMQRVEEHHDQR